MSASTLLLRADASVRTGTGHVMRCLALAQAWQDAGGQAVFAIAESTPGLQKRLAEESCEIVPVPGETGTREDVEGTLFEAAKLNADWIVVDGYQFAASYQEGLKAAGMRVLCIDDYGHAQKYSADVVLNQNACATTALYPEIDQGARLLLGPRYALLRREFVKFGVRDRVGSSVCRRLLVMMGGSDPENITVRAIEAVALARIKELATTVLVGGASPQLNIVQQTADASGLAMKIIRDARNVPELMAQADVALSAAGSTCWELCFLGVPSLLVDVAENQTPVARELDRMGCAVHIGGRSVSAAAMAQQLRHVCDDRDLRASLSHRSSEVVDGKGASRVVSVLRGPRNIRVRHAAVADRHMLWEWANDPAVRAASFSEERIPWEDHVRWFEEKLANRRSTILVGEDENADPVGQIRFDQRPDGEWEVDVSVADERRGRGLASQLIQLGIETMRKDGKPGRIHAFVKPSNMASVRAFERSAFRQVGTESMAGQNVVHLICDTDKATSKFVR